MSVFKDFKELTNAEPIKGFGGDIVPTRSSLIRLLYIGRNSKVTYLEINNITYVPIYSFNLISSSKLYRIGYPL